MNTEDTQEQFFIGWDVGGWNCDKNRASRDAIVILDSSLTIVGNPWRGNLRESVTTSDATSDWLSKLFLQCQAQVPATPFRVLMAIDTPLGFSDQFRDLVSNLNWTKQEGRSGENTYLFRFTERWLYDRDKRPLSAVQDQIGSQATKGMHVLAKFAPTVESCGVWTDGECLRVIETYPTVCRDTQVIQYLLNRHNATAPRPELKSIDENDALICALVAHTFVHQHQELEAPSPNVSLREGWIWAPA